MTRHYLAREALPFLEDGKPNRPDPWNVTAPTLCGDMVEFPWVFAELSTPIDCPDCDARADAL